VAVRRLGAPEQERATGGEEKTAQLKEQARHYRPPFRRGSSREGNRSGVVPTGTARSRA
jgi:hypothetical protein